VYVFGKNFWVSLEEIFLGTLLFEPQRALFMA
jgi:hypothetical protein